MFDIMFDMKLFSNFLKWPSLGCNVGGTNLINYIDEKQGF